VYLELVINSKKSLENLGAVAHGVRGKLENVDIDIDDLEGPFQPKPFYDSKLGLFSLGKRHTGGASFHQPEGLCG